ncbi:MAG: flagellar assembly protein FliH [Desulfuromonadales bacterium]|nr:flagellar assembly protein FliH [Desulfuromonadales bacterium]MBN2792830.1 flagellar assembly protein FliH [Desulfuromonadales bacterium]
MSLSKIYRGAEADGLQQFQFRSFGDTEPVSRLEPELLNFVSASDSGVHKPVVKPTDQALAGPAAKDLEEAYARGRREGLAAAEEAFETTTQALAKALEEVSRLRESLANSSRQDMLRLVMAVAEQIIRREVAADPTVVLTIIENALQSSVRADQYRIRVSPDDLEKVTEKKPLFLASISGLKNLSIEADASVSAGGCRVDSELGAVDATIETQLEAIQQALLKAIPDV